MGEVTKFATTTSTAVLLKTEACKKLLVQLVLDLALDLFVDELVKPQCIYRRGNRKMVAQRAPVINLLVTGKFTI